MVETVRATYRVQLRSGFGFREAAGIAGYLERLGISHLYPSPLLQARSGSTHGYDVVDPHRVSEELGGTEAYRELVAELEVRDLGQVMDMVPNHMAISGPENPWWWDVLENGPSSRYARYFDIDWGELGSPARRPVDDPPLAPSPALLLPLLRTHYGRVLEEGGIEVRRSAEQFFVEVEGHRLPASPRSVGELLRSAAEDRGGDDTELAFVADAHVELPSASATDRASTARRHRDRRVLALQLRRLLTADPITRAAVDRAVETLNGDVERLDHFMARQNYRLAWWSLATEEVGYRRFFHINELVALRAEEDEVFEDTHLRPVEWIAAGILDGLRVDHPDGLRDPEMYFRRLRTAAPNAWIVAEKILEPGEPLRESWEVDGTTGYDFLNLVGGLQMDPAGEEPFTALYSRITGGDGAAEYEAVIHESRMYACSGLLGSDLNRLAELFRRVAERHRLHRDHARSDLRDALIAVATGFPAYRTYVRAEQGEIAPVDVELIGRAMASAREHRPDLDPDPLGFLEDILLLRVKGELETELVMRFQQFTAPVAAKGVEDTAFYRYNRFVALNEVGGDPGRFHVSPGRFHAECERIQSRWPRTMLATSTHDTKRSEDVRARLHLLSEIPGRWGEAVDRWFESNSTHRGDLVDRNTEYLCYQTLAGAWPIGEDRLLAYLEKSIREAGVHTLWTEPSEAYEGAIMDFARGILGDGDFIGDLEGFVEPLIGPGRVNSLAQTLIRLTAPGIPDLYQGCELWDLSLVDPDNRRPVDFDLRQRLLGDLEGLAAGEIMARADEGLPKLHVIREGLAVRGERPECFGREGGYRALTAEGEKAKHVVAFARGEDVVTLTPRLVMGLSGEWESTRIELPEGRWRNRLTGMDCPSGSVLVRDVAEHFPVALLVREGD